MRTIKLNEDQIKQIESIILEIPTKWGNPLLNILGQGLETQNEDPKPIGGSNGGGSPRPPKNE